MQRINSETLVHDSEDALARAAAEAVVEACRQAVKERGRALLVLTGGSTPRAMHAYLSRPDLASRVDWRATHVFWGDDRAVGPLHDLSNYRMAHETLLSRVPLPPANIHRIRGEEGPEAAASRAEAEIVDILGGAPWRVGEPTFDYLLLGMGDDAHVASLFPGSPELTESERAVVGTRDEHAGVRRVTFTFPLLASARQTAFVVAGAKKADAVARVFASLDAGIVQGADVGTEELPAARAARQARRAIWMLDTQAAARLPQPRVT
jgi:6-phosphogluconolactonase